MKPALRAPEMPARPGAHEAAAASPADGGKGAEAGAAGPRLRSAAGRYAVPAAEPLGIDVPMRDQHAPDAAAGVARANAQHQQQPAAAEACGHAGAPLAAGDAAPLTDSMLLDHLSMANSQLRQVLEAAGAQPDHPLLMLPPLQEQDDEEEVLAALAEENYQLRQLVGQLQRQQHLAQQQQMLLQQQESQGDPLELDRFLGSADCSPLAGAGQGSSGRATPDAGTAAAVATAGAAAGPAAEEPQAAPGQATPRSPADVLSASLLVPPSLSAVQLAEAEAAAQLMTQAVIQAEAAACEGWCPGTCQQPPPLPPRQPQQQVRWTPPAAQTGAAAVAAHSNGAGAALAPAAAIPALPKLALPSKVVLRASKRDGSGPGAAGQCAGSDAAACGSAGSGGAMPPLPKLALPTKVVLRVSKSRSSGRLGGVGEAGGSAQQLAGGSPWPALADAGSSATPSSARAAARARRGSGGALGGGLKDLANTPSASRSGEGSPWAEGQRPTPYHGAGQQDEAASMAAAAAAGVWHPAVAAAVAATGAPGSGSSCAGGVAQRPPGPAEQLGPLAAGELRLPAIRIGQQQPSSRVAGAAAAAEAQSPPAAAAFADPSLQQRQAKALHNELPSLPRLRLPAHPAGGGTAAPAGGGSCASPCGGGGSSSSACSDSGFFREAPPELQGAPAALPADRGLSGGALAALASLSRTSSDHTYGGRVSSDLFGARISLDGSCHLARVSLTGGNSCSQLLSDATWGGGCGGDEDTAASVEQPGEWLGVSYQHSLYARGGTTTMRQVDAALEAAAAASGDGQRHQQLWGLHDHLRRSSSGASSSALQRHALQQPLRPSRHSGPPPSIPESFFYGSFMSSRTSGSLGDDLASLAASACSRGCGLAHQQPGAPAGGGCGGDGAAAAGGAPVLQLGGRAGLPPQHPVPVLAQPAGRLQGRVVLGGSHSPFAADAEHGLTSEQLQQLLSDLSSAQQQPYATMASGAASGAAAAQAQAPGATDGAARSGRAATGSSPFATAVNAAAAAAVGSAVGGDHLVALLDGSQQHLILQEGGTGEDDVAPQPERLPDWQPGRLQEAAVGGGEHPPAQQQPPAQQAAQAAPPLLQRVPSAGHVAAQLPPRWCIRGGSTGNLAELHAQQQQQQQQQHGARGQQPAAGALEQEAQQQQQQQQQQPVAAAGGNPAASPALPVPLVAPHSSLRVVTAVGSSSDAGSGSAATTPLHPHNARHRRAKSSSSLHQLRCGGGLASITVPPSPASSGVRYVPASPRVVGFDCPLTPHSAIRSPSWRSEGGADVCGAAAAGANCCGSGCSTPRRQPASPGLLQQALARHGAAAGGGSGSSTPCAAGRRAALGGGLLGGGVAPAGAFGSGPHAPAAWLGGGGGGGGGQGGPPAGLRARSCSTLMVMLTGGQLQQQPLAHPYVQQPLPLPLQHHQHQHQQHTPCPPGLMRVHSETAAYRRARCCPLGRSVGDAAGDAPSSPACGASGGSSDAEAGPGDAARAPQGGTRHASASGCVGEGDGEAQSAAGTQPAPAGCSALPHIRSAGAACRPAAGVPTLRGSLGPAAAAAVAAGAGTCTVPPRPLSPLVPPRPLSPLGPPRPVSPLGQPPSARAVSPAKQGAGSGAAEPAHHPAKLTRFALAAAKGGLASGPSAPGADAALPDGAAAALASAASVSSPDTPAVVEPAPSSTALPLSEPCTPQQQQQQQQGVEQQQPAGEAAAPCAAEASSEQESGPLDPALNAAVDAAMDCVVSGVLCMLSQEEAPDPAAAAAAAPDSSRGGGAGPGGQQRPSPQDGSRSALSAALAVRGPPRPLARASEAADSAAAARAATVALAAMGLGGPLGSGGGSGGNGASAAGRAAALAPAPAGCGEIEPAAPSPCERQRPAAAVPARSGSGANSGSPCGPRHSSDSSGSSLDDDLELQLAPPPQARGAAVLQQLGVGGAVGGEEAVGHAREHQHALLRQRQGLRQQHQLRRHDVAAWAAAQQQQQQQDEQQGGGVAPLGSPAAATPCAGCAMVRAASFCASVGSDSTLSWAAWSATSSVNHCPKLRWWGAEGVAGGGFFSDKKREAPRRKGPPSQRPLPGREELAEGGPSGSKGWWKPLAGEPSRLGKGH